MSRKSTAGHILRAVRKDRRKIWLAFTAEFANADVAGTDFAEMIKAVDAGRVTVGEFDLDGISAHGGGSASRDFGPEHGQSRGVFFWRDTFILAIAFAAGGAGAMLAKIGEIIVAGMRVGPGDVDSSAGGDVDFHFDGLLANV